MFSYDTSRTPPAPFGKIRVTDELHRLEIGPFVAHVDTGSDFTCLPRSAVEQLQERLDYELVRAVGFDGRESEIHAVKILKATVEFLDSNGDVVLKTQYENLRLPVLPEGLLGRDILNHHFGEFDGPRREWALR